MLGLVAIGCIELVFVVFALHTQNHIFVVAVEAFPLFCIIGSVILLFSASDRRILLAAASMAVGYFFEAILLVTADRLNAFVLVLAVFAVIGKYAAAGSFLVAERENEFIFSYNNKQEC